jgi:excisionase family DNA binding protein
MNTLPPERLAVSVAEAAQMLGCHPDTVRRAINANRIRAVRIGRKILIQKAELERILKEGA